MFTSLSNLISAMQDAGAKRFYAKRLAPNDNSKNQVYLGGGFDALNIIPHSDIETDFSEKAGAVRRRDKASVEFYLDRQPGNMASTQRSTHSLSRNIPKSGCRVFCRKL